MRVSTDLKSGNAADDAGKFVKQFSDQTIGFFTSANQQAAGIKNTVGNAASSTWQSILDRLNW